jgi:hypothetical protein
MEERRKVIRRRVLKAGTVAFGQFGGIDCVVKNISPEGALLSVENSIGIPDSIILDIAADKFRRSATIVWRRQKSIGVRFANDADFSSNGNS